MTWVDTTLVVVIITMLILIVWARIMQQTVLDTVVEIRDIVKTIGKK